MEDAKSIMATCLLGDKLSPETDFHFIFYSDYFQAMDERDRRNQTETSLIFLDVRNETLNSCPQFSLFENLLSLAIHHSILFLAYSMEARLARKIGSTSLRTNGLIYR
jgi:hypothetical protein